MKYDDRDTMNLRDFESNPAYFIIRLASVVLRVDSTVHWINRYPADNTIHFDSTYQLHSDLTSG